MDFKFNEMEQEIIDMLHDFCIKEVKPIAAELDEKEQFTQNAREKLAEMGMLGTYIPEEYGGAGLSYLTYIACCEELAKYCASTSIMFSVHGSLCSWPILEFGTEEQKQKYLVPLAQGEKLGAMGLTEPSAGTDANGVRTTAVLKGDKYILNGTKIFITNGYYADTYVVFARTNPDLSVGHKGLSAFIVEKGFKGFSFGTKEKKMGIRASATYELVFDDCEVPAENLLGKEGEGFKIAMMLLDGGRIGVGAQALGIAQGAIDEAIPYLKQRKQFGKPLSSFQNTQFELADMQTKVDAARLLLYRAAEAKAAHEPYSHLAAMGKLFASEVASDVTRRVVQLIGGCGYTREYPFERMMRDAKITEIYEGTSEVQRMVISGWMLKK
ncbi:MAG: acyl-CoA dehydrogenase [Evtepia sp.]